MTQTHTVSFYSYSALGVLAAFVLSFGVAFADNDSRKSDKKSGTGVEIQIGSNGNALVRGAKVTSVASSTISAKTNYGSSELGWRVVTNGDTDFVTHSGANSGLSGIAVGDTISFRGTLDQAQSGLTVNAKVVKDWTQVESKKTLSGIVTSINATLNSFTLSHDNATTTVETNSSTDFDLSNGQNGTFASIFLNAKVKVKGMLNASSSVLTATEIDISTSTTKWGWDNDDKKEWRDWIKSKVWMNWR